MAQRSSPELAAEVHFTARGLQYIHEVNRSCSDMLKKQPNCKIFIGNHN